MQFSKITSNDRGKGFLIKLVLILVIIVGALSILNKIDFPSPNKEIEKIIPNEKLKIIK
jgi:hypothetical protein|tara:strand:- start:1447 stop:1623 length:177 start_codon:yes stop_codon:yes gene_type:complete